MTQHQGLLSEQGAAATSKGASRGSQWAVGDAWGKISLPEVQATEGIPEEGGKPPDSQTSLDF